MTIDLALRRQIFAEDLQVVCNLSTPALVDALASVPREAFLGPGPWLVMGEGDIGGGPRRTPDSDPRHVYHNLSIAIDPARQLFNGAPGVVSVSIDALALRPGARVLHVGAGWGYYTALIARCVGPTGRVLAFEVDEALAAQARSNLNAWHQVELRCDDASRLPGETFDAILFNAGVTHPHDAWLDALAPGGRMVLPLTASFGPVPTGLPPVGGISSRAGGNTDAAHDVRSSTGAPAASGPAATAAVANIGKGPVIAIARSEDGQAWTARVVTFIAVYSAIGLRDDAANARLGEALKRNPFPRLKRLRRDRHEAGAACWLPGETWCFALD
jgi:protein-L-isoaspartate(D-aspartate) O-methyltransferase